MDARFSEGTVALTGGSAKEQMTVAQARSRTTPRPRVQGKFLFAGTEKLYIRGVTYGTFRPDADGNEYPAREVVERDFAQMAANGINSVRTYTPPPLWLLDAAHRHGLRIMVGLAAERWAAFFDYRKCARSVEAIVREK